MVSLQLTKRDQLESILNSTFKEIGDISDVHDMTNTQLKRIIQKIEVDKDGNVDIYLHILGKVGLDDAVLICNDDGSVPDFVKIPNKGKIAGRESFPPCFFNITEIS